MKCKNCGLVHKSLYTSDADCFSALQEEVDRLRDIIVRANNHLFDASRHVDDVEHTIECHADTVNDHFRAVAKEVAAAMEIVGAEVLDMLGG